MTQYIRRRKKMAQCITKITFILALLAARVTELGGLRTLNPTMKAPQACARSTSE